MGWVTLASGGRDSIPAGSMGELRHIGVRHHIHLAGEGGDYESLALHVSLYVPSAAVYSGIDRSVQVPGGFS